MMMNNLIMIISRQMKCPLRMKMIMMKGQNRREDREDQQMVMTESVVEIQVATKIII